MADIKVHILPFRFRSATPERPSEKEQEFYRTLARLLFDDADLDHANFRCDETIPVPTGHNHSYEFFSDVITERFDPTCTHFVVDMGGVEENGVPSYNVLVGLNEAAKLLFKRSPLVLFGVLISGNIAETDAASVGKLVTDRRVRLIVKTGEALGAYYKDRPFPSDELKRAINNLVADPAERLRRRLIRRVGIFDIDPKRELQFYYYDGRDAHPQIRDLVFTFVNHMVRDRRVEHVYVDSSHSLWFTGPVKSALKDAGIEEKAIHQLNGGMDANVNVEVSGGYSLVILPIVRTGESLRRILSKVRSDAELERVVVWSLLSVAGDKPMYGTHPVPLDGLAFKLRSKPVTYALKVPAEPVGLHAMWRNARDLAVDPSRDSLATALSAAEMWGMIFESGLVPESPVPTHRDSLGLVPDYGNIALCNGPLIAARISSILDETYKALLPPTIPFLLPREPNAEALANCVSEREGNETILISREIVSSAREARDKNGIRENLKKIGKKRKSDLLTEYDLLARRLEYLSTWTSKYPRQDVPRVVLMDEFEFSGQTLRDMFSLARIFDLEVLCAICLGNLGKNNPVELPFRFLPLYHLDYSRL